MVIIRITVKDNDITERLKDLTSEMISDTLNRFANKFDTSNYLKFLEMMNPNVVEKPNIEQKAYIEKCLLDTIKGKTTDEYILKNLSLKIVDVYRDKWENGEVLYYFTREKIFLNN